jgi:hypothetical protein
MDKMVGNLSPGRLRQGYKLVGRKPVAQINLLIYKRKK